MPSPTIGNLLPLCSQEKVVSRDGNAGPNASIFLPFYDKSAGHYFFDGKEATFRGATIPQDRSRTLNGLARPDTFMKDCCTPHV